MEMYECITEQEKIYQPQLDEAPLCIIWATDNWWYYVTIMTGCTIDLPCYEWAPSLQTKIENQKLVHK